nr:RHS repeat-associated core domain-containing protein [Burkholderia lata]
MHYNRHRYYDPGSWWFVSKDPIGLEGGLNVFQYVPNPIEWIDPLGLARLSLPGSRKGKDFTRSGKEAVKADNIRNHGSLTCEKCNTGLINAVQHQEGVTPPDNEAHVDHKKPKAKNGSGTPENGQVLCRVCNLDKSDSCVE